MRVSANILDDTLKLFQLARQAARINGQPSQAERLAPLVDDLTSLVAKSQRASNNCISAAGSSILAQNDFKKLLETFQTNAPNAQGAIDFKVQLNSPERNRIVTAMANGGMNYLDIARQMGMTIEEVKMIITLQKVQP